MPTYTYRAMSVSGAVIKGSYAAATTGEVVDMLHQRGSYPIAVEERRQIALGSRRTRRVTIRDIAVFCRQFYSMLNAGVSIVSCLEILQAQTDSPRMREVISAVYVDVQKGLSLSEAMQKHTNVFPALLVNLVASGELSGNVDDIMYRTSQYYEKEAKLINKIRTAAVYPIILSVTSVAVVTFLLTFVMPTFISMFTDSGVPLPLPTLMMIGLSRFLQNYWYILVLLAWALVLAGRRYARTLAGRRRIDRLKFRLPLLKRLTPKIVAARFARTMATLLHSGIPVLVALESVGRISGNTVVEDAMDNARTAMRRGQPLSSPIMQSAVFPPMVHHMIRVGEESGTLDQLLDKTADYYDEEVETAIQQLTTFFEPVMIVIMAVIVGFIVISMIMPVFDMGHTVL